MIKLKDILAESKNIELGKLTTMKDDRPFMTEEQWMEKWDGKQPLDEGKFTRMISGKLREIVAKMVLQTLEKPEGIAKLFRISGGKAVRTQGLKAMPRLKGLYTPLVKYVKTGRLSTSDAKELRTVLTRTATSRTLSWSLAAPFLLVVGALFSTGLAMLTAPIMGEIIKLVYDKWGVEWFLQGWDEDNVDLNDIKRKVSKAASKNLSNPPKLPTHIGGIPLQNY